MVVGIKFRMENKKFRTYPEKGLRDADKQESSCDRGLYSQFHIDRRDAYMT